MHTDTNRLHLLYEVNARLATFTELDELLRYATRHARELLDAEGCAVLLLDGTRREFYFPVASQSESRKATEPRLAEVRFPADRGIAGWVLAHDEATAVEDAEHDARFYSGVDRLTGVTTRSVLCAPLRTRGGSIGVLEVVNPGRGASANDLDFLQALASDIAVAYEKATLYERLRGELIGVRQVCGFIGLGLATLGLLLVAGALYTHVGWALPWGELPRRPGMLAGLACVLPGAVLLAVARGWLVRRTV
jgi:GAF domain-containing protein